MNRIQMFKKLAVDFADVEYLTRGMIGDWLENQEGITPALITVQKDITNFDLRIGHGKYRVPNEHDIARVVQYEQSKSHLGRPTGIRWPDGYNNDPVSVDKLKAASKTVKPVVTEEMLKTPVRGPKGHFLGREAKIDHFVDQGYVMPE